jgi:hypothetical protein
MWEGKHFWKCDCCTFVFIQAVSETQGRALGAYYIHTNNRKHLSKHRSLDASSMNNAPFYFLRRITENEV